MVAEVSRYYLQMKGLESGPFAMSQLSRMWVSGAVTADAFYRLANVEEWTPIGALAETLEAIAPATKVPTTPALAEELLDEILPPQVSAVPVSSPPIHSNLLRGDGTRQHPFVIHTASQLISSRIQGEIINSIFGPGTYQVTGERRYSQSPMGMPNNGDICEHRLIVEGRPVSVWFDLYLVTRLVDSPELQAMKNAIVNSPAGNQLRAQAADKMDPTLVEAQTLLQQNLSPPIQRARTINERLKIAQSSIRLWRLTGGEGPSPLALTDAEISQLFESFRTKWIAIHGIFWVVAGTLGLGAYALWGAAPSLVILTAQFFWKKRQLLCAKGLSDAEIAAEMRKK